MPKSHACNVITTDPSNQTIIKLVYIILIAERTVVTAVLYNAPLSQTYELYTLANHYITLHTTPQFKINHVYLIDPTSFTQFRDPGVRLAPREPLGLRGKEVVFFEVE